MVTADVPTTLSGYQLGEQLYTSSRTLVYRAVRSADQQPVILKLLRNGTPTFSDLVQFRNQYTIVQHLNIPSVIQTYSLEPCGNGYVLVMEDFDGVSLAKFFYGQPLDLSTFLAIALQLADGLHALYQYRIIHKDLKPDNILIHPQSQQVKLIDFLLQPLWKHTKVAWKLAIWSLLPSVPMPTVTTPILLAKSCPGCPRKWRLIVKLSAP